MPSAPVPWHCTHCTLKAAEPPWNAALRNCLFAKISSTLAAAIALTLRDAKTDAAVRPAYFDDGYFYLMPGESKEVCFQVDCKEGVDKLLLRVDGYNVELKDILLNK